MPRKCCVPHCKSNYESTKKLENIHVTTFAFPKCKTLAEKWLKQINRENFCPCKTAAICIKHFDEQFIIREDRIKRNDGTELVLPRTTPKLTADAYPTIFLGQPAYFTSQPPKKRKTPDERFAEAVARDEKKFQEWCKEDTIASLEEVKQNLNKVNTEGWSVILGETFISFLRINTENIPFIETSIKLFENLTIKIWRNGCAVPRKNLNWILGDRHCCDKFSKLENLLSHFKFSLENQYNIKEDLLKIQTILQKCIEFLMTSLDEEDDQNILMKLNFFHEQFNFLLSSCPRYSVDLLLWSCSIFFSFPSSYTLIRNSKVLQLPHPNYLKTLTLNLGSTESGITAAHSKYLEEKCKCLQPNERVVNVLLDEIYVKTDISYKGGRIEGQSYFTMDSATTIQAFMITSVFSKNRDIAALFPVKNLSSTQLHELTLKVLHLLKTTGYQVLSLISDNNRINRNMFTQLCGGRIQSSVANPYDLSQPIFLLFDTVHILKAVRNNWLNQDNQSFVIPDFIDDTQILVPTVKHLKIIHDKEKCSSIKLAPSLSRKVLYPSSLERQNVQYAVKLLDEKNIAALQNYETIIDSQFSHTKVFLEIISRWWRIVNVKHPRKGIILRDTYSTPVCDIEHDNLHYLKSFCDWLVKWDALCNSNSHAPQSSVKKRIGKLTAGTQFSILHTTKTLIDLALYMLTDIRCAYVLFGQFQTDKLEARFGNYRQMSGCNYHVSVAQILESERKLKFKSLLKFNSISSGELEIKTFLETCSQYADNDRTDILIEPDIFDNIIQTSEYVEISEETIKVILYMTGYVGLKVSNAVHCEHCTNLLLTNQTIDIEISEEATQYLTALNRGGLKWPNQLSIDVGMVAYQVFETLLKDYESEFLKCKNHKYMLKKLIMERLIGDGMENFPCENSLYKLKEKSVNIWCNILLNNYCKNKKDFMLSIKTTSKKPQMSRKLKTLQK